MDHPVQEFAPNELEVIQLRAAGYDADHLEDLVAVLAPGGRLPPCEAMRDAQGVVRVWDGAHRVEAHRRCGRRVPVRVRPGEVRDAKLAAAAANQEHGLRRTNADKRNAVAAVLDVFQDWGDRKVGVHCGVSHVLVGAVRGESKKEPKPRQGRDGKMRRVPAPVAVSRKSTGSLPKLPPTVGKDSSDVRRSPSTPGPCPVSFAAPVLGATRLTLMDFEEKLFGLRTLAADHLSEFDDADHALAYKDWVEARAAIDELFAAKATINKEP